MDLRRAEIDSIAAGAAYAVLALAAVGFLSARNGAALVMCATCLAGVAAGRLAGVSGPVMLAVVLGLAAILWMVWVDPPATSRRVSALAHAGGGALVGWALALTLHRRRWPAWALAALAGVLILTVAWELAEFIGDRILDTALIPSRRDSAEDIAFGCLGGAAGVIAAGVLLALRSRLQKII